MAIKRILAVVFLVAISAQTALPHSAFAADDTGNGFPVENVDGTLTVSETFSDAEEAPVLPEGITQNGQRYTIKETTTVPDPDYVRSTRTFTRTLFSQVPLNGINSLGSYFPASVSIDEGDYRGEIGLDPAAPYTVVSRYETFSQQVDREQVFHGLPDNDVSRLPLYYDFEVSSSAVPGATEVRSLQRLDVSYEVAGVDSYGLPNSYTAYVTYRGEEEYLEPVFYDVTANYTGELESSEEQMVTIGVYSPVERIAAITESAVPLAEPLAEPGGYLFPLVIAGAVVVMLLATPLLLLFFLNNARLIRVIKGDRDAVSAAGIQRGSGKARTELVCRRRLVLRDGVAEFRIPPDEKIFGEDAFYVVIKPRLAEREGDLMMTWQGKTVAVMPLAQHIDIDFREMMISSTEAVLAETDL